MTTHQIELIDFRLIDESPLNPRTNFDEASIKELAENISKQGLLQPITVRVYKDKKIEFPVQLAGKTCYQIVCGARRYKASVLAGMKVIPSIIREMTDEEAFDAMITENLQRKDVEPMDEARAFYELHKRGTSFEELAARFGKSISFIRLRIKLNDLVPELVELLEKKELQISHAQELCKLTVEHQATLFKDRYSSEAPTYYRWNEKALKDIKNYIESDFRHLDKAIFDKTGCENCEFRCGANALFAEYSENKCTNPDCFDEKTNQHYVSLIVDKVSEGYLLVKDENLHTSMQDFCNELESSYPIIERHWKNSDYHNIVEKPELPKRDEDDTDEDWAETLEAYEDDLKEYETDLAEENERLQDGFQKALRIGYNGLNEIIIKFKDNNNSTTNSGKNVSEQKIDDLQDKDKRNAEIKNEKQIEELRTLMIQNAAKYREFNYPITETEQVAMYALMLKKSPYQFKRDIENKFDYKIELIENIKALIVTPQLNQIIRAFIYETMVDASVASDKGTQSVLRAISKEVFPDEAIRIELKHEETYLKRKESIDKQIKEISK